jgi:hypothetical protein
MCVRFGHAPAHNTITRARKQRRRLNASAGKLGADSFRNPAPEEAKFA